ncbi:Flp pilus assembly protein TadD, contains TPR repeats [Leminorella richardii]|uniref:Flp pilus assembly protein TadD, contains TPR repeats n=1 Tax=Leminorella richardii TaxID=158841 RepID=A0A2X4XJ64_9GAMM|nr:type IV pilus biogenesis/stability protein PilW [Leminorella richardii]SQI36664.1 Flp pilus assembly protein TadD, contains TPR repeats [Leminorella richardii]
MRNKLLPLVLAAGLLTGCATGSNENAGFDVKKAAQIRLNLGLTYLTLGNVQKARFNLERALEYAPEDYRTQLGMALYLQEMHEDALAEGRYQQALRLAPQSSEVLNNYGAFLCRLGQYEPAQRYFGKALQSQSLGDIANSLESSGYCLLSAGQTAVAMQQLSRALKQDPSKGDRALSEFVHYFQNGKRKEAAALLEVYHQALPATAESIWMQIQFAASENRMSDVQLYGKKLAREFSQSRQYQLFLAHEY